MINSPSNGAGVGSMPPLPGGIPRMPNFKSTPSFEPRKPLNSIDSGTNNRLPITPNLNQDNFIPPVHEGRSRPNNSGSGSNNLGFDVDELVKKIDAKIAELEEEEKREKEKQEKEKQANSNINNKPTAIPSTNIAKKEEIIPQNNNTISNKNEVKVGQQEINLDLQDNEEDDDFFDDFFDN